MASGMESREALLGLQGFRLASTRPVFGSLKRFKEAFAWKGIKLAWVPEPLGPRDRPSHAVACRNMPRLVLTSLTTPQYV